MMVLRRRVEERLIICTPEGRRIEVCVCRTGRGYVRLGINADKDVTVHREEVQRLVDAAAQARG